MSIAATPGTPGAAHVHSASSRSNKDVYDRRYQGDYRQSLSGYEVARFAALRAFIPRVARASGARTVLDYGCGSGLHIPLWEESFPHAALSFADISPKALDRLAQVHPRHAGQCHLIEHDRVPLPGAFFDAVVSVEVMEHVVDLGAYVREVHRLLRPGGVFVWTTPCANAASIEHAYNVLTRQIEPTPEGSRRWRWEDPTHVRRLTSREARRACLDAGFARTAFRFRAHLFSFACTRLLMKRRPRLAERLMGLDYALFRALPNAASMIGAAWKA